MTCYEKIHCPACSGDEIGKAGYSARGVQRYRCRSESCPTQTFMLNYPYNAYEPSVKELLVERAINGSGVRDTTRVLKRLAKGR